MGMPPYQYPDQWESAGFNTAGVGMSATESIFSSEKALAADPLVPNGLGEISINSVVLPYVHSAKEGVERLGGTYRKIWNCRRLWGRLYRPKRDLVLGDCLRTPLDSQSYS